MVEMCSDKWFENNTSHNISENKLARKKTNQQGQQQKTLYRKQNT